MNPKPIVVVVTASSNAFRALRTTPKRTQLRRYAAAVGKYGQHGAEVTGKIRSVMTYGAFVDVGARVPAYLHVADIGLLPRTKVGAARVPRLALG